MIEDGVSSPRRLSFQHSYPFEVEQVLRQLWDALQPARQARWALCLAYSGGLDSHVLLHALCVLRDAGMELQLSACHINHQLQAPAARWQQHCAQQCEALGVRFTACAICMPENSGEGLEACARRLRYAKLASRLQAEECLLTAHHADDQAETVLLQAIRGAGVDGLAAMPSMPVKFFHAQHLRPLLACSRQQLETYAQFFKLNWVEDPSNQALCHARNVLRHQVLPLLKQQRAGARRGLQRVASHMAEAQTILNEVAAVDYQSARIAGAPQQLSCAALVRLSPERVRLLLRYWLRQLGYDMPNARALRCIQNEVLGARADAMPQVRWGTYQVRRYQGRLYCLPQLAYPPADFDLDWQPGQRVVLPAQLGELTPDDFPNLAVLKYLQQDKVQVRFRRGGERLVMAPGKSAVPLKLQFYRWQVAPWQRGRIPLLFCGDTLIAVHGHWQMEVP